MWRFCYKSVICFVLRIHHISAFSFFVLHMSNKKCMFALDNYVKSNIEINLN